jgi:carbonic anhydrase
MMSQIDPLLERNRAFAATGAHQGLKPLPRHQVLLLTCLEPRLDPAQLLGPELGDALVIRNSGGRVTNGVIEEIAYLGHASESMFGAEAPLFEVSVIHHTGCGTGLLADPDFRRGFAERIGADDATLAELAVTDPEATVQADVELLRQSPLRPARVTVSGHVYDVDTGLVRTVVSSGK